MLDTGARQDTFSKEAAHTRGLWEVDVDQVPDTGLFLGMLRSDLDDSDGLLAPWSGVPPLVERLIAARAAGKLSDTETLEALAQVKVVQSDGTTWMVGAQSMRWYRKTPSGAWSPAVPPPVTDDPSVHASVAAASSVVADALAPR